MRLRRQSEQTYAGSRLCVCGSKQAANCGDYTASAIMAIAKNKSFIGIDGNVKRVLSRIYAIQQNKDFIKNIEKKITTMKVSKNCSDLMQGIMEIAEGAASAEVDVPKFELPPKTEISEYDLCREPADLSAEELKELCSKNTDPTKNCIAVGGEVLQTILAKLGHDSVLSVSKGYFLAVFVTISLVQEQEWYLLVL